MGPEKHAGIIEGGGLTNCELTVELERWTNSPVLRRLVVELRQGFKEVRERASCWISARFWRGAGHGHSCYERRTSFSWAVIGPAGGQ